MQKALNRKLAVDAFYTLADAKIAAAIEKKNGGDKGVKYMILENAKATGDNISFWGVSGLKSTWTANMKLERKTVKDGPEGARGMYEGELTLTLTEIKGFDEAFAATEPGSDELVRLYNTSAGLYRVDVFDVRANKPTTVSATASGHVSVDITTGFGELKGELAVRDMKFDLDMVLSAQGTSSFIANTTTYSTVECSLSSASPDSLDMRLLSFEDKIVTGPFPYIGTQVTYGSFLEGWPGATLPYDRGNLFDPIAATKTVKAAIGK
jgi:hypothetical protein